MKKERLDVLVTQRGLTPSREKARALIMAGAVYVDGERADKPGTSVDPESEITLKEDPVPYVSRGGLKLEKALSVFPIDLTGVRCMDVGASTGGFTDCMLQNGAASVIAIDVGRGQFDWKLRNDPRVSLFEKTNIRYVKPEDIPYAPSFAAVDVSFISLSKVLPAVRDLLTERCEAVLLIKPQFEAGRSQVGKKGVVRDPSVHEEVIEAVLAAARENGFAAAGLDYSPVRGPEGNIEYLLHLVRGAEPCGTPEIRETVERAHSGLGG